MDDDTDLSNFYNTMESSKMAQFVEIAEGIKKLGQPIETDLSIWLNIQEALEENFEDLALLEIEIEAASTTELDNLLAQKETLLTALDGLYEDLFLLEQTLEMETTNSINNLIAINNAIQTSTDYELYEKQFNDIYLKTLAQGNLAFSDAQKTMIENVAALCPLKDGVGVLGMQTLQALYGIINDVNDCIDWVGGNSSNFSVINNQGENTAQVFPNPTADKLKITLSNALQTNGRLEIYNLNGQKVKDISLEKETISTNISTQNLNSGLYILQVKEGAETILTTRFAVSK